MVLMLSVADAVHTHPIVGFLVLSAMAFVSSLYFWWRYHKDAKEVEAALDRVRLAKDEAERLLWQRSHEYHKEYLDADYPDKQAIWNKNTQMWDDYEANPIKYIGDELSGAESAKYGKLSRIWEAYIGAGLLLVALLLLVFVGVGLWGVAILAFFAFLFATGWAWVDDSEYAPVWLWRIPASIAAATIVAVILIPVSGWATNSPPPAWVAQTHEVTLARQADGTYGVGEPAKMRLDGTVSKGWEPNAIHSWAETDSSNIKRSYELYYTHDSDSRRVYIIDDLAEGEDPYVQHYLTFNVLNGYADADVCAWSGLVAGETPQYTRVPCSERNAWGKQSRAIIHIPRGKYDRWVTRSV
jgi:hypothetical protein